MSEKPPVAKTIAEFREHFFNRRTVPYEMFRVAEMLVETGLAEREQVHATKMASLQQSLDHERTMRKHAEDEAARITAHNTNLREEQENLDDGTLVKVMQPRLVGHRLSDGSTIGSDIPRPWQLHEVEALVYRLRVCGGSDSTEVRFKHGHAEATVPYPEMSLFERPGAVKGRPAGGIETWVPPRKRLSFSAIVTIVSFVAILLIAIQSGALT